MESTKSNRELLEGIVNLTEAQNRERFDQKGISRLQAQFHQHNDEIREFMDESTVLHREMIAYYLVGAFLILLLWVI